MTEAEFLVYVEHAAWTTRPSQQGFCITDNILDVMTSLDALEMSMDIEQNEGIYLSDEALKRCVTLLDFYKVVLESYT